MMPKCYHIPKVWDKVLNNFHLFTFNWKMPVNFGIYLFTFYGLKCDNPQIIQVLLKFFS